MTLADRILDAIDAIVTRWPNPMFGGYVRYAFWKRRFAHCGEGVRFGDRLTIHGFANIRTGDRTSVMSGSYWYANDGGILQIGSNCSFNHNVLLDAAGGEIIIGDDVLVGPNTVLRAADHEYSDPERPIRVQGHRGGKIVIGSNVWLAANVVVTAGVRVGSGCVVGAGSIVTHDLPPMTICVGNPARPIRSRLPNSADQ